MKTTAHNPIHPDKRLKLKNDNAAHHLHSLATRDIIPVLDCHALGHVIDLVNTNKSRGKLELENVLVHIDLEAKMNSTHHIVSQ